MGCQKKENRNTLCTDGVPVFSADRGLAKESKDGLERFHKAIKAEILD